MSIVDAAHGVYRYRKYGCRCAACVEGKRSADERSRRNALQRGIQPYHHGTFRGYNAYKCRCDVCRAFISAYERSRRAAAGGASP